MKSQRWFPVGSRIFLGYTILAGGILIIPQRSLSRLKNKVRKITQRNRGVSLERIIEELNKILPGWVRYFKLAQARTHMKDLDGWIRRKLRCYKFKQLQRSYTRYKMLVSLGVKEWQSWLVAQSGKRLWRLSSTPQLSQAMSLKWFQNQGMCNLEKEYLSL